MQNEKMCTFAQKEKKKALNLYPEEDPDVVYNVTKEFVRCIDEADFDRMHKITDTVYGFVDKPALLPDIVVIIDKLTKSNKAKVYTLDQVIKLISVSLLILSFFGFQDQIIRTLRLFQFYGAQTIFFDILKHNEKEFILKKVT